jgi:hypothetical protein
MNIVGNIIIFILLCNVLKSQCINASCHDALCCVIIMNLMIHMYFISKGEKISKIIWTISCQVFGFIVVVG